jgi:hypothetical protein
LTAFLTPKAPNLPVAPAEYDRAYTHGLNDVLRLYFTRVDNAVGQAMVLANALNLGTGAPDNGNGVDGDFYFRRDGGAMTTIYQKRTGAWVGIV